MPYDISSTFQTPKKFKPGENEWSADKPERNIQMCLVIAATAKSVPSKPTEDV